MTEKSVLRSNNPKPRLSQLGRKPPSSRWCSRSASGAQCRRGLRRFMGTQPRPMCSGSPATGRRTCSPSTTSADDVLIFVDTEPCALRSTRPWPRLLGRQTWRPISGDLIAANKKRRPRPGGHRERRPPARHRDLPPSSVRLCCRRACSPRPTRSPPHPCRAAPSGCCGENFVDVPAPATEWPLRSRPSTPSRRKPLLPSSSLGSAPCAPTCPAPWWRLCTPTGPMFTLIRARRLVHAHGEPPAGLAGLQSDLGGPRT